MPQTPKLRQTAQKIFLHRFLLFLPRFESFFFSKKNVRKKSHAKAGVRNRGNIFGLGQNSSNSLWLFAKEWSAAACFFEFPTQLFRAFCKRYICTPCAFISQDKWVWMTGNRSYTCRLLFLSKCPCKTLV